MQLTVGDIIEGKITAVKDYGVFVELENSKFGMVHISEIAQSYVSEIRDFVKEGDTVKVKVHCPYILTGKYCGGYGCSGGHPFADFRHMGCQKINIAGLV